MSGDEPLARCVVSKNRINIAKKRLRAEAFVPHPHREMSVFRVVGLGHVEIRTLGQIEYADKLPERKQLLAWVTFQTSTLAHNDIRLSVKEREATDDSHVRHRNIVGWPEVTGDPKRTKSMQKEIALLLSERTTPVVMADGSILS